MIFCGDVCVCVLAKKLKIECGTFLCTVRELFMMFVHRAYKLLASYRRAYRSNKRLLYIYYIIQTWLKLCNSVERESHPNTSRLEQCRTGVIFISSVHRITWFRLYFFLTE